MDDIALIIDNNDALTDLCEKIESHYSVVTCDSTNSIHARIAITNSLPNANIAKRIPTIFLVTDPWEQNIFFPDRDVKRNLINAWHSCKSVFCFSSSLAKVFESTYRYRPEVQLPYVKRKSKNEPKYILHNGLDSGIISALSNYEFRMYSGTNDLANAILYVDVNKEFKTTNYALCQAASYGVPSIVFDVGVNFEACSSGDVIVPSHATNAHLLDAIKISIRDRQQNSLKNKESSQRFDDATAILNRIDSLLRRKTIDTSKLPMMARSIREEKSLAKIKSGRAAKPVIMGKRETIQQRERRLRRIRRHNEELQAAKEAESNPGYRLLKGPSWFYNDDPVDVSIIVPMFRSRKVIEKQILEWDFIDDGLTKEIIYVDDACPHNSYEVIVSTWEKQRQFLKGRPVGKVIVSKLNRGYAGNCNLGAKHAKGKYLVFMNADAFVTPNWLRPLYDAIQDEAVGIVGNMQLSSRNEVVLDSAGSQWVWSSGSFEHVGKSIYHNRRMDRPFNLNSIPEDLKRPSEREMVTGCCFIIPKDLFLRIEGYDDGYKVGYWEDSDMNMAVKNLGYKIMYQPDSKVMHVVGHTKAHGHEYIKKNRDRFYRRWVHSGFVDNIATYKAPAAGPRPYRDLKSYVGEEVIGCIIACNEEEFLEASVRSIAPMCDRFVFVIGGNQYAYKSGMCDKSGLPTDSTMDIAKSLAKEFNGIVIEPPGRTWHGKTEMRNAYVKHLKSGNWMFMLDGDEVYKESQLWTIAELMHRYECLRLQHYTFWNNVNTVGFGRWEDFPQERLVKWREGYHYYGRNHLFVSNKDNKEVCNFVPTYSGKERLFYHYSWVRPIKKIQQKLDYYVHQLTEEWNKRAPITNDYINEVFLKWRTNPEEVKGMHPCGGGDVCQFAGIHPYQVTKLIQSGKLNFDGK